MAATSENDNTRDVVTTPTGERNTEVELSVRLFRWKWTLFRYENRVRRTPAANAGS